MRRNAAGQKVQVMMRTSAAAITAVVSLATRTVSTATNATPIDVTTTAAHGMIPGNRVEISGVGGNTAANGTFVVKSVPSTTRFTLGDTTDGTSVAGNGTYTSGGTVTPQSVNVFVSKDGGALTTGAGTLSHIGRGPFHIAGTPDVNQLRALTAITSTVSVAGATAVTVANGGINSSTYGLWSYTPTAAETNAANVAFTFTAPAVGAISVTQTFEPTSGPILLQTTIATLSSQTSFTLTAGSATVTTPPADDDALNGCLIVVYDASNTGEIAYGVILDYTGSTRTVTLLTDPAGYTIAAGDYVTIIADPVHNLLNVDTFAEPTGVPAATTTLAGKIGRIYQTSRNKLTVTATKKTFFDDADAAMWEKDLTDDGTTYTETEGNAI